MEGLETNKFINSLKKKYYYNSKFWREVAPHAYIKRSLYSNSIKKFISLFGKKKVLLIKSEDLNNYTKKEIEKVCKFLKVSKDFKFNRPPSFTSPNVKNLKTQIKLRKKYGDNFYKIIEQIRRRKLNNKKFDDIKKNINFEKKNIDKNSRIYLNKFLCRDIKKISKYVNFETNDWK